MRKIFIYIIQHKLKPLTAKFTEGLTINNLNKFVVRHFDRLSTGTLKIRHFDRLSTGTLKIRHFDRLSTGTVRAKAQSRLRRELSRTIRPSLTPALRLGLVGTRHTGALALMAQQHEVVHVIYCQSLRISIIKNLLPVLFALRSFALSVANCYTPLISIITKSSILFQPLTCFVFDKSLYSC